MKKAENNKKNKVRKGTKYFYNEKLHCKEVVELQKGTEDSTPLTLRQICSRWGITEHTLDMWKRKHPEFKIACKLGKIHSLAWFEKQVEKGFFDTYKKREGSSRINMGAIKFYAFLNYGISENRQVVKLPEEYKTADVRRRGEILCELLAEGIITMEQYKTLNEALTVQYERDNGLKILEAAESIKKELKRVENE